MEEYLEKEKMSETRILFMLGLAIYFGSYALLGWNVFFWALGAHFGGLVVLNMARKLASADLNAKLEEAMKILKEYSDQEEKIDTSDNVTRMYENDVEFLADTELDWDPESK